MVKNNIKSLRKMKNITQLEMAQGLQVTRQTILTIENHRYNPSLELPLKISKYFELKIEDIFFLEE